MAQNTNETFEQYRKRKQQEFNGYREARQKEFDEYRRKRNEEFAEYLNKKWKDIRSQDPVTKPKDDKTPPVVIKDEDKKKPKEDRPVVIEEVVDVPKPKPQPEPIVPIEGQEQPVAEKKIRFSVYGTAMQVRADEKLKFKLPDIKGESLANAWKRLSSTDYNNLISDCLALRKQHNLCDWSYLRMLDAMSAELLGKGSNEAELLKAFVYCQSGYQMRLAANGSKLDMLYASQYYIFNKPCWKIDGVLFYTDDSTAERISVCEASFPHEQAMSMVITEEQQFASKRAKERIIQSKDVEWMAANVTEDENLMAFCNDYPSSYFGDDFMTRWAIYANAPMSKVARDKLYPQLRKWINGREMAESVNILCHWIQTAFVYEYDDKVWGGDRAFFPDETLYYPYCDCEDRSILLTRIVRDLLGLKCALVYYPGHLATAIAVGEDVNGDFIRIDGTKYIVCDPTYIGAPIGMTMPGMDNKAAKVIVL